MVSVMNMTRIETMLGTILFRDLEPVISGYSQLGATICIKHIESVCTLIDQMCVCVYVYSHVYIY